MLISRIKNKIANLNLNIFRGIISIFLISFFLSSSLLTSYAQATTPTPTTNTCPSGQYFDTGFNACLDNSNRPEGYNSNTAPTSGSITSPISAPVAPEKKEPTTTFCSDTSWGFLGGEKLACYIWYAILKVILEVVGAFTRLTAYTFDWAVNGYILNIKTLFLEEGVSGQDKAWLYKSWAVIRDVTNILMFFSAMYVGVKYILGSEELDFKKSLIKIIIFAVFVNFSFAFAKFAIDTSNFASLSIRGGIIGYDSGTGISEIIIKNTGISTTVAEIGNADKKVFVGYSNWTSMALAIVFLASAFFVFLYATVMILVRAIVLLACVIFSPFMFLTSSFKSLEKLNQMWRDNFIGQLIFGPVFMIGLWLSVGFLSNATTLSTSSLRSAAEVTGKDVAATGMMALAVISLFLTVFAANKVSTGLGGAIGGFVGSGMKNIGLGVATGGAGLAIRGGVGRIGAMAANSKWLKDKAQNGNFISRRVASGMSLAGDKMANAKVTIGGRTTTSTADKNNQAKDKMNKDQSDFIENNKGAINANPALRDELYKARGDKNKFAIVSAKLDPKNAGKTDGQLSRELGIVSDSDIEKAKARKLENKDNLQANRVSSSNTDAYLDAKDSLGAKREEVKLESTATKSDMSRLKEEREKISEELKLVGPDLKKERDLENRSSEIETEMKAIADQRSKMAQDLKVSREDINQYKNTTMMAKVETKLSDALRGKKSNSASPAEDSARSNDALTPEQSANLKK